ncbi:MAG: FAD-binding oxidoreductase [Verrucomicrobiota bacterium]
MNVLFCQPISGAVDGALLFADEGEVPAKYVTDESRRHGVSCGLALPKSTVEVAAVMRETARRGLSVVVSGARTGISAGAVPDGEAVLSLERMNRICGLRRDAAGRFWVHCEAGVLLGELQASVRSCTFADSARWDEADRQCLAELRASPPHFYAPDPTETGASVGGTIACDASGAHTFRYGATRRHVRWLRMVLADGSVAELARGECRADEEGRFVLRRADGSEVEGRVPMYPRPPTKNAAGYWSGPGMDLVDLLIGSEGTLGVITEAEVELTPLPECRCAATLFCPSEAAAIDLTRSLRKQREALGIEALEYVDAAALNMLRDHRRALKEGSGVPECLPDAADCVLHVDLGLPAAALEGALEAIAEFATRSGADPEDCWTAVDERERERLRVFRHAVPECVNNRIAEIRRRHPSVTKLGTDMAVPDEHLGEIMRLYREGLARSGLDAVIFGHIGDNHVHVNIIPRSPEEYEAGKRLYRDFARRVVEMNGSVAAEHGIGKLKVPFLTLMLGEEGLNQMREVKAVFDPEGRLSPGTMLAKIAVGQGGVP